MSDTTAEALRVQHNLYRSMSVDRKFTIALDLSDDARDLTRSGIRLRHPDLDDEAVERLLWDAVLGEDLAAKAWSHRMANRR